MSDAPARPRRELAVGLAVIGAACLGYAAAAHQWLADAEGEAGAGLLSLKGMGQSMSNGDVGSGFWSVMGIVTLVACIAGAVGLAAAAALALANKRPDLPLAPTTLGLLSVMTGIITGCLFVATKPGGAGALGVGMTFWIFGVGCVLGIAGGQMLAKVNRADDPDTEDAMNPDDY